MFIIGGIQSVYVQIKNSYSSKKSDGPISKPEPDSPFSPPHSLHDSRFLRFPTVLTSILLQPSSSMEMMVEGFCWV
ncbi:hypothetical protein P8452_26843 [Trifolium repens]|nr:hypothetical protein P8452_26843 [Trifolium repens]